MMMVKVKIMTMKNFFHDELIEIIDAIIDFEYSQTQEISRGVMAITGLSLLRIIRI